MCDPPESSFDVTGPERKTRTYDVPVKWREGAKSLMRAALAVALMLAGGYGGVRLALIALEGSDDIGAAFMGAVIGGGLGILGTGLTLAGIYRWHSAPRPAGQ
jgi:hypothetical protein